MGIQHRDDLTYAPCTLRKNIYLFMIHWKWKENWKLMSRKLVSLKVVFFLIFLIKALRSSFVVCSLMLNTVYYANREIVLLK